MAKIAEIVKVQSGYANFVNLRESLAEESENTGRMAMYRPTKAHRVAMERLSRGLYVPNEKKFYLLNGSYGTGKSHLCLMLANLLSKSSDDPSLTGFYDNYAKLDTQRARELKNVRSGGQFLVAICDYGSGRKFEDEVLRSIVTACEQRGIDLSPFTEFAEAERLLAGWEASGNGNKGVRDFYDDFSKALEQVAPGVPVAALRSNLKQFKRDAFETFLAAYEVMQGVEFQTKAGNLVSIVRDLVRSAEFKAKFMGIAVFYDEFGTAVLQSSKFEAAVMQAFMEEICQHENNVLFIGCIHKNFKDYAERTNQATAAVMEARITQVSLANEGIEEIIGAIVETKKDSVLWREEVKPREGIFNQLTPQCAALKLFPWITDTNRIRERVLEDIYGMHPMALHCLLKLSSEIGSDVRSTFTFFSGGGIPGEPGSYSDFIHNSEIIGKNGALSLYLVDKIYLFFEKELSPSSRELLDIQRNLVNGYAGSLQALRKIENPQLIDGLKEEKVAVLRTILIYALCGIPATLENIEFGRYCTTKPEKKQLKGILTELEKAGAIYLRRTSQTYELCATEGQDPVTLVDNLAEQPETLEKATVSELLKQSGQQEEFLEAKGYNLAFSEDKRLKRVFVRGRELGPELWEQLQSSYDKAGAKYGTSFEGHAVYAICEDEAEVKMAREAVKLIPPGNILVAVPHEASPFSENLKRVIASRHLLTNEEAAKHPAQVIARIRDMLDNGLDDGYLPMIKKVVNQIISGDQSTWYQGRGKLLVEKPLQSHKPADMFCESTFLQRCQIKHPDLNLLHDDKWQRNSNTPLRQAVDELLNTASEVRIDNGNPENHGEKRYLQKVLLNGCGALKHLRNNGPVTEFFVESDPSKIDAKFPVLKELLTRLSRLNKGQALSLSDFVREMRLPPYGAGGTSLVLAIACAVRAYGELLQVFADSTHSVPASLSKFDLIVQEVGNNTSKLELALREISANQRRFVDSVAKACGAKPLAQGRQRSVVEAEKLLRGWWHNLPSVAKLAELYPDPYAGRTEALKQVLDDERTDPFERLLNHLPAIYAEGPVGGMSSENSTVWAAAFTEDLSQLNNGILKAEQTLVKAVSTVFEAQCLDIVELEKHIRNWFEQLTPDQRNPSRCDENDEAHSLVKNLLSGGNSFHDMLTNQLPSSWGIGELRNWTSLQFPALKSKWEQAKRYIENIKPLVSDPVIRKVYKVEKLSESNWAIEEGSKVEIEIPRGAKSVVYECTSDENKGEGTKKTIESLTEVDLCIGKSPRGMLHVYAVSQEGNTSRRVSYLLVHKQKQYKIKIEKEDLWGDQGSFKFPTDFASYIEVLRSLTENAQERKVIPVEAAQMVETFLKDFAKVIERK
jgi:hypothetical protein